MRSFKDSENFRISKDWPGVLGSPVEKTSDETEFYNCFAYVADDQKRQWQPLPKLPRGTYWPVPIKDEEENTLWPIFLAYATIRFDWCNDGNFEDGWEKIAIYVIEKDGEEIPTHVAIQRQGSVWQSKLGENIDVSHSLEALESSEEFGESIYGKAKYFMSRKGQLCPVQK